jgi:antitoxin (DNA-binding transcriptional repressor) of toxin-antitoxin stability system
MLSDVEAGESYRITRHNREIGWIVPPGSDPGLVQAKKRTGARTQALPTHQLRTAASVDQLLDEMAGPW